MIEALVSALLPAFGKFLEAALADDYDVEKEREAIFALQRAAAELRLKKLLA